jgi:hypothetical protein
MARPTPPAIGSKNWGAPLNASILAVFDAEEIVTEAVPLAEAAREEAEAARDATLAVGTTSATVIDGVLADPDSPPSKRLSSAIGTAVTLTSTRVGRVNILDYAKTPIGVGNAVNDTAALKAVIEAARVAKSDVQLPAVNLLLTEEIILPIITPNVRKVSMFAPGAAATSLKWVNDLGPGKFGIRAEGNNVDSGTWFVSGLTVTGPNRTRALEVAPCQMEGIEASRKGHFVDVVSNYFKAGFRLNGDHVSFLRCYAPSSYYAVYYAGAVIDGDISMVECDWTGTTMSSFGIGIGGRMSALSMVRGHLGFSPYGIFVEPGVAASISETVVYSASFYGTSWESFGAAACYDSDAVGIWRNMHFIDAGNFTVLDTVAGDAYVPTRPRAALFRLGTMSGWIFDGMSGGGSGSAAPAAMISAGGYGIHNSIINAVASEAFQGWISNGRKLVAAGGGSTCGLRFNGYGESGVFRRLSDQGPIAAGQLVALRTQSTCQPNDASGRLLGIARYAEGTLGAGVLVIESSEQISAQIGSVAVPVLSALVVSPADPKKLAPRSSAPSAPIIGASVQGDLAANSTSVIFFRAVMA